MATSDLCELLKRPSTDSNSRTFDSDTERRICTAVLRLLHDKSNDVQAVAVKTLGVLLTTVPQELVLEIGDSLADQVLDTKKNELRDVYAIRMRTLIKTIPSQMGDRTSEKLIGRLLDGIRASSSSPASDDEKLAKTNEEIVLSCLDVLTDLLGRFGASSISVTRQHEPVLQICLNLLISKDASVVVRKRAGNALGCLSVVLSDALLVSAVERLLGQIDESGSSPSSENTRALIRTMCTVSSAVGNRLQQPQIDRILPIFLKFTDPEKASTGDDDDAGDDSDEAMDDDGDNGGDAALGMANELRESCFMGFESFVQKCPNQVEPHIDKIVQAAIAYMSYDPNYSYGIDEDDDEMDGGDGGGDDDDDDDYGYDDDDEYGDDEDDFYDDDDDDESWKVRRSAIRALTAIVEANRHDPGFLWTRPYTVRRNKSVECVASALVARFKEREENCRVGVLETFAKLLEVTTQNSTDSMAAIDLGNNYAPGLVKACEKILGGGKGVGERSKSHALSLLSILCKAPGGLGGEAEILSVFKHIQSLLGMEDDGDEGHGSSNTSKALRLDALSLVVAVLESENHDPSFVRKALVSVLLPQLCASVKEQWYKVIAEGLRALAAVPKFFVDSEDASAVASKLYDSVEPLLAAHDVDQEIKECALTATASLLTNFAGEKSSLTTDQTDRLTSLLLERLRNETTRILAIKTLSQVSSSNPELVFGEGILKDLLEAMAGFLKMSARTLRQTSLEALDVVVTHHGPTIVGETAMYSSLLSELSDLVVDSDLHISHLALRASISTLKVCPASGASVNNSLLPKVLVLSSSPLLQDLALDSLLATLEQVVNSNAVEFAELLGLLRGRLEQASASKHAIYNLAQCIAVITSATSPENRQGVVTDCLQLLDNSPTPDDEAELRKVQLALLISGDLGRMIDLGSVSADVPQNLNTIYMGYFESPSEDLKNASSFALGRAAVGAQSVFLPAIVGSLEAENNSEKKQYLLLSALRGFIQSSYQRSGGDGIAANLPMIMPHLENHASDEKEGIRSMVAECLGSLTCMQPSAMSETLCRMAEDHATNGFVCWTVATSIKHAIAGKADPAELAAFVPRFLNLIKHEDLGARNAALLMVYSAVHHMPQLVAGLMKEQITPTLYEVATLQLKRKIDLGPFSHTVDDALPLRKAALSIFATCLENIPGGLDMTAFMPVLAATLKDVEDIQLQAHQIVIGMCLRQPSYIVAGVESFVEPLEKTLFRKEGTKTGTELERLIEWKKSALRAMVALSRVEGAMNSRKFAEFVERTRANSKFRASLEAIEEER